MFVSSDRIHNLARSMFARSDRATLEPGSKTLASASATLHRPNAHATISGNSARHSSSPCEATRSLSTTSAPAPHSAAAHRVALPRKNGSSVPATRYVRGIRSGSTPGGW
jgi:hypothetical protein